MKYLPKSLKNYKDLKTKEYVSYAALLGGINVANASTCLPHRLQQAMGSVKEFLIHMQEFSLCISFLAK